jgi:RNA polymerase sigma-70 factor (ECF subfamily)
MEPVGPDDAELVKNALAGDREAFGQLYDKYARLVRAVVVGVSGDWSAAEDLTQECFLRAYRRLTALRELERFGPWISGIARRVALEHHRAKRRDRHEFRNQQLAATAAPNDGPADIQRKEAIDTIMEQLAGLPEQERLAIHLFFLKEEPVEDVAEVLGLSRSGIYALVQRAIARLAAQLKSTQSAIKVKR